MTMPTQTSKSLVFGEGEYLTPQQRYNRSEKGLERVRRYRARKKATKNVS